MTALRPIRVLHSLGSLRRGGIETWLINVLRQRHPQMQMDFILQEAPGTGGDYEREALAAGCVIHHYTPASWITKRLRILGLAPADLTLRDVLRAGNYDALHVHGEEFIGDTVKQAAHAGTPVRVTHCHHTMLARGKRGPEMWVRSVRHRTIERNLTLRYATDLVACGRDAGRLMLGDAWGKDPRCQVIYCGVTLGAFERALSQTTRAELLARYALPPDAKVIGHAGSMGPVKNHSFLVRIFAELAKRDPRYYLFMAGDGRLRPTIEKQVRAFGLYDRARMPGLVADIPELMIHLFDVHVLPSLAEGLPVVVIEASAAGLFTVCSNTITSELGEHLPGHLEYVSLAAPVATWADAVEAGLRRRMLPKQAWGTVRSTPLCIESSVEALVAMYRSRLDQHRARSFQQPACVTSLGKSH
ncbi:MAG: glycosyltransferase [Verrucomicrobiota bacterium]|jgi:glycosyltransferase involved in cell wall biosynthesis